MVAIEICADYTCPKIWRGGCTEKDNSDSLHNNSIFPYTYFTDISIPLGGIY